MGWQHTVVAKTHFTLPSTKGVTVQVFVIGPVNVIIQRSSLTVTLWRKLMSMGTIIIPHSNPVSGGNAPESCFPTTKYWWIGQGGNTSKMLTHKRLHHPDVSITK